MKKSISLFLIIALLCLFSSCAKSQEQAYPITVNGTQLDSEIFRYYLDEVWDTMKNSILEEYNNFLNRFLG